jgi:hypothetical protein
MRPWRISDDGNHGSRNNAKVQCGTVRGSPGRERVYRSLVFLSR